VARPTVIGSAWEFHAQVVKHPNITISQTSRLTLENEFKQHVWCLSLRIFIMAAAIFGLF
jgi:hypothetical protein